MFKKIKQKLYEEYNKSLNSVSQATTNYIIKKDYYSKAKQYKKQIHSAFEYFLTKYINIVTYLKDDFKFNSIIYKDNKLYKFNMKTKEEIEEELKSMNGVYKHYIKKKFFNREFTKGISLVPLTGTIEKWRILSIFLDIFPELLKMFENKANSKIYKDIDIDEINQKLTENSYLKEDFSYIMKQVKDETAAKYGS